MRPSRIYVWLFLISFLGGLFFFLPSHVSANTEDLTIISVFTRDKCARCKEEKEFLEQFKRERPLDIRYYDLNKSQNRNLFGEITSKYGLIKGTPITLVNGKLIQGFGGTESSKEAIKKIILEEESKSLLFEDVIAGNAVVVSGLKGESSCDTGAVCPVDSELFITIPLIGKSVDVSRLSLAGLALVLGLVDGFNPCALWVLIMFLAILLEVRSKRKMVQYAGLFILAEAAMYYLILSLWFNVWNFITLDRVVTPLIGILALGSGVYFLYKFATYKPVCNVASPDQRQKLSDRVKSLASKPLTISVMVGILGLAFSVNIFEFACSIGIPQTFTKILEMNELGWFLRNWYTFLYIIMYMVDDFIVFGLAIYSYEKIGLTHKYSKWSTLVGGIIMIGLGLILLIKPSLLVF